MLSTISRTSRGLRVQLSLALAVVVFGTALLATVYSSMQLARVARDAVQGQLLAIARSFDEDFEAGDLRRRRELRGRLRGLIQLHPGVTEVAIDTSGARGRSVEVISRMEHSSERASGPLVTGVPEYVEGRSNGLHVGTLSFPLRDGSRPVAVLRVSLDMAAVDQELAEQRRAGIVLALLEALVLTGALGTLLGRRVLRPLRQVERATRRIREGQFDTRLGWGRATSSARWHGTSTRWPGASKRPRSSSRPSPSRTPSPVCPTSVRFEERLRVELQRAGARTTRYRSWRSTSTRSRP